MVGARSAFRFLLNPHDDFTSELAEIARDHHGGGLRVVSAWATEGGVNRLANAVRHEISDVRAIVGISSSRTTVEGLLRMLQAGWDLSLHYVNEHQLFHPKVFWFVGGAEDPRLRTVVVGSGNLTEGGMAQNVEASLVVTGRVDDPGLVALFRSVEARWEQLAASPQSHQIGGPDDLEQYFVHNLIVSTRTTTSGDSVRTPTSPSQQDAAVNCWFRSSLPTTDLEYPSEPSGQEPLELPRFLRNTRRSPDDCEPE